MIYNSFCNNLFSFSRLTCLFFVAVGLVVSSIGAAEIDGPATVDLGEPIVYTIAEGAETDNVIWHVFGAGEAKEFGGTLCIWCKKPGILTILAVVVPVEGAPEKLTTELVVGDYVPVDDDIVRPEPDRFGMIKAAREAGTDTDPLLRRLVAQVFRTVATQMATTPPEGNLTAQVAALQEATVTENRRAIKENERPKVVPALTAIMQAINDNEKIKTFADYLTVWNEISIGLDR